MSDRSGIIDDRCNFRIARGRINSVAAFTSHHPLRYKRSAQAHNPTQKPTQMCAWEHSFVLCTAGAATLTHTQLLKAGARKQKFRKNFHVVIAWRCVTIHISALFAGITRDVTCVARRHAREEGLRATCAVVWAREHVRTTGLKV